MENFISLDPAYLHYLIKQDLTNDLKLSLLEFTVLCSKKLYDSFSILRQSLLIPCSLYFSVVH